MKWTPTPEGTIKEANNMNETQKAKMEEWLAEYPLEVVQEMMSEPEFFTLK